MLVCSTSINYTKILGILEVLAALVRVKVVRKTLEALKILEEIDGDNKEFFIELINYFCEIDK
jgi:hypothetical protein